MTERWLLAYNKTQTLNNRIRYSMNASISNACDNYCAYLEKIIKPAANSFLDKVSINHVQLHDAFGINLFLAHAIDYIYAIREVTGIQESRKTLVQTFDSRFGVMGNRFGTRKFELIDAVNNALKHIQLDQGRYNSLVERYGSISFNCLVPDNGRVLCILDGFRFDYSRVILRPAIEALSSWHFEDREDVLAFACEDICVEGCSAYDDYENDSIDQMIAYCNPVCEDCNEPESDCMCATFLYDGKQGEFVHDFDSTFDFDGVMSRISGAYRP